MGPKACPKTLTPEPKGDEVKIEKDSGPEQSIEALIGLVLSQQELVNKLVDQQVKMDSRMSSIAKMDVNKFDGSNINPRTWIQVYDNLCMNNGWKSFRVKTNRIRAYLEGTAKELQQQLAVCQISALSQLRKVLERCRPFNRISRGEKSTGTKRNHALYLNDGAVCSGKSPGRCKKTKSGFPDPMVKIDHFSNVRCTTFTHGDEISFFSTTDDPITKADVEVKYPSICRKKLPPIPKFETSFELQNNFKVISAKPYQLSAEKRSWLDMKIRTMLNEKIIRPSSSEFASPCIVIPKKNNFRLCIDYRRLNDETTADLFPFP
ncbi:hypothetical protein LAZ67_X001925 [Cordylochernes scorpioides]|uniref:Reverse transcriptase n=1 Tax=Cordylochernes scorpioides TaxID=51811 RepID=A0ABY6LSX9_9ARAC|nr:hypothetical protein LAZ67_X001925 [Cordylochernes scorpioides]